MDLDRRFRGTSHVINGKTSIDTVTVADFVQEASTWGIAVPAAEQEVRETMLRVHDAVSRVAPPEVLVDIRERMTARWQRTLWPAVS